MLFMRLLDELPRIGLVVYADDCSSFLFSSLLFWTIVALHTLPTAVKKFNSEKHDRKPNEFVASSFVCSTLCSKKRPPFYFFE